MIFIFCIILYIFLSILNAGIFGGLLAFLLSRPGLIVSSRKLAIGVLFFVILYEILMYALVTPLDLTITTKNQMLINLYGKSDISDILKPSFGFMDIIFYALDVFVGTWIGKLLVTNYYKRYKLIS